MPRRLYLFNTATKETGRSELVEGMNERDIHNLETAMWNEIEYPWVVRDSINDPSPHPGP